MINTTPNALTTEAPTKFMLAYPEEAAKFEAMTLEELAIVYDTLSAMTSCLVGVYNQPRTQKEDSKARKWIEGELDDRVCEIRQCLIDVARRRDITTEDELERLAHIVLGYEFECTGDPVEIMEIGFALLNLDKWVRVVERKPGLKKAA